MVERLSDVAESVVLVVIWWDVWLSWVGGDSWAIAQIIGRCGLMVGEVS